MPYNSVISRANISALIPEDVSAEILSAMPEGSVFMRMARRLPDMSTAQRRLPVLSVLPTAYFVAEATQVDGSDYKQTTHAEWDNLYINAEEIACIVPIPESALDDANYDIWAEVRPLIVEAIGVVVDAAAFHSTNKPSTWPAGLVPGAVAKSNSISEGTLGDLYDDIMGATDAQPGLISLVEEDGYFPTGAVSALSMRGKLRGLRDSVSGQPLFKSDMQGSTQYSLDGIPLEFPRNGAFDGAASEILVGDFTKAVYSVRQDITYKLLTEGVIQDPSDGSIAINLAQQDMVALRVTFRMGWQVANVINRVNATAGTRFPFAVLTPAVSA